MSLNIFEKIKIKENEKILILNSPANLISEFKSINKNLDFKKEKDKYDRLIIFIFDDLNIINKLVNDNKDKLIENGRFYLAYPKKSSPNYKKFKDILTRDNIWLKISENNFRPVSLYSLNEDFSLMFIKKIK